MTISNLLMESVASTKTIKEANIFGENSNVIQLEKFAYILTSEGYYFSKGYC